MTVPITLDLDSRTIQETSMVDLAFQILRKSNEPYYYRDLMREVARLKGMSDEEINEVIAQLYTEINIDGRFACLGQNLWGLKRWYPVEKADDNMASARTRLINDDDDDDYDSDDDLYEDNDFKTNDDDDDDNVKDDDDDVDVDGDKDSDDDDFDEDDEDSNDDDFTENDEDATDLSELDDSDDADDDK